MVVGVYRFSVGNMQCVAIDDNRGKAGGAEPGDPDGWSFVNASADEVARVFADHSAGENAWRDEVACTCLYIDTGSQRVIVDTGSGEHTLPGSGLLLTRLNEVGVDPAMIDMVLLTHGHWDHIGANAGADGRPLFPNARYLMTEAEFRHWTEQPSPFGGEIDEQGRAYADANLTRLRDRFVFIEPEGEVLPGIRTMPAPGHTPGQVALLLEDSGQRLLCTADTFHHPCELVQPEWYFDFDHDPETTVATRKQILGWAADEDILVHVYHCPFPGLGKIERAGDHWEWIQMQV